MTSLPGPVADPPLTFPPRDDPAPERGGALAKAGVSLRRATAQDLAFLKTLFASFRAQEMALVPWPEAAKTRFLENQFALQHRHFTTRFAGSDFLVVEVGGQPVGRLYVDRGAREHRVVDIGLLPAARGRGLGEALLRWVIEGARSAGAANVSLSVALANPRARKLYERLGFQPGMLEGAHLRMGLPLP